MSIPDSSPSSILVDVELPTPTPLPAPLVALLSSLRVVVVGWYPVPEQTSPGQARDQFGEEAQAALHTVVRRFRAAGAPSVTRRLVFTGDELDTLARISAEEACNAVLIPGPVEHLRRLLVPLRGRHNVADLVPFVADLVAERAHTIDLTLLHVLEEDETSPDVQRDLFGPIVERLAARGVDTALVERRVATTRDPTATIVEAAAHHDLVVLGETEPSVRSVLFGTVPERIVRTVEVPVVVVRHLNDALNDALNNAPSDA